MQVHQTLDNTTKNFQVTFILQALCLPSRYQRRVTGWQPVFNAEWTTIAEARESLSKRATNTKRWSDMRVVKRVHHNGDIREYPVT